jgi:hypothetical protein
MPPVTQTFRDAELSLWQSVTAQAHAALPPAPATAVRAALGNGLTTLAHPFLRAAEHAGTLVQTMRSLGHDLLGTLVPSRPALTTSDLPPPSAAIGDFTQFGLLVMSLARKAGDDPDAFKALLTERYTDLDPGWIELAVNYFVCVKLAGGGITGYRRYQALGDFVIDGRLPDSGRVALVADFGTGTEQAAALLRLIAARDPDVVIHLGDVYYAGTRSEYARVRQQCLDILRPQNGRPLILTMSGNHDMYSGGEAYYEALDALGQPASYFCLRNASWQFVAMDTGLRNSALVLQLPTTGHDDPHGLDPDEAEWVKDKVANADGRNTILLSHHQPFSAFERLTAGGPVNEELLGQLQPVLGGANRWYWGHEHDLVIYLDEEKYQDVLGRCIGHAAIPLALATYRLEQLRPRATADYAVPSVADVGLDPMSQNANFYNHGYLIIDLDGPAGTATHYQASDPEKVLLVEKLG